ncbi:CRACD-like protein isoform X2 [Rhinichthys klamathensis goyatoka]|uniref:CRACD-like protein isoform X2 n=1 Tax=Rhinichthys klamathensis goyatoka TaxID=3034132 RepID=UPI0024B60342|nr:CRACD-like protein isoform X2 [Rhinichthys klamathensis goyatoka]
MKRRTSSQNSGVGGSPSNCDIMASGSPDVTDATEPSDAGEECSGKKKSKFQTFKNFFVKKKRKESPAPSGESGLKASQSSDDVNTSEPTISHANSDNDRGSKINLGNKAMSHDSVFVSDSPLSETNEGLGASQDSIHGKVKSLQLQLKHAICLGSPPSLLCGRKGEDAGAFSDDDGLPCSPPEYSSLHTVLTTPLHTSVDLTQSSLSMEASDSEDDQMSYEASSRPATPQGSVPVDFSLPASSVSCLDSSAARHRIAVNANARAKRKPASREMLDRRRDLRERVLLRDTEDKLRMVTTSGKEEREDLVNDSDPESCASGLEEDEEEEEVTDSSLCHKTSPTSSISAESVSEGEEHVPAEDHVPKSELPESSWESPVTLDLQADDFLLDTGCEVVPEEQGSLLEEVLSSLKSPLVSGLALEHENMVLQSEVKDINSGSVVSQLEEDDLLDPSNPIVTPEEPAHLPDSPPESPVDSEEISEETTEEEELLEDSESADESLRVPEADADKQVDTAKEDQEFFQSPKAFAVTVKERDEDEVHEDVVEEEAELERETKDGGDGVEKEEAVEPEKPESSANDEPQGAGGQRQDETSVDHRELVEVSVENVSESDQTVRDDIWSSTETTEDSEVLLSTALESPILHSQFSNASMCPLEQEEEAESGEPDVSTEPQEESSEKREVVSEHQDQPVLESPTGEPRSSAEGRPRFTIAPAWQRSQFSGGTQEQTVSLPETNASSPQTYELFTPVKEERPVPDGSRSSPSLPMQRETIHVHHEETSPENPFGVRLRKTPVLHRYGLDGESSRTHTEASGAQETPDQDQNARKPVLPNKPDLIVDAVMSARKIPDAVGRISAGSSESPSWISVARQKQKNFMETSAEKLPSQGEDKRPDSPSSLSNPVTKEQLAQPCSPLQVCCSLELSNTSMLEKESKRSADPSAAPLAQDEPPWLALAKKKAKAWSEMPQIVQ